MNKKLMYTGVTAILVVSMLVMFTAGASAEGGYTFVTMWPELPQPWYFCHPEGIAVDGIGNVFVADTWNHCIQKLDTYGNFITRWGSYGNGDGEFKNPMGIAVDSNGNVYVADALNNRIQKFDSDGNFITKWGSHGTGDGEFTNPHGIAVDSSGNVFVADTLNNRIQKFDSDGNFITKWGSPGTGDGEFDNPRGITTDSSGNVYVTDTHNDRIQKFDSDGNFITKWGSYGTGDGEFRSPEGIAVDSSGYVYIADYNSRIQKFDSDGNFITKWGSYGNGDGEFNEAHGIALDSSGNVYVADSWNNRIQKFDSDGNFITKWGSPGTGDGEFDKPRGITTDSSGNIYVTDTDNDRIQKFDSDGNFITKWGSFGHGDGEFDFPVGIAVDGFGNVFVADRYNHRIQKFDSDGNFITKWGSYGTGEGEFYKPRGIAVDSSGYGYVADSGNHRIQKFDSVGNFITKWGSEGTGDGEFNSPRGIAVDSSGNVYVADTGNWRIQKFDSDGNFIIMCGSRGDGDGEFCSPEGIAVDSSGYVYVADANRVAPPGLYDDRIQKFDSDGNFITKWGESGSGDGEFDCPEGIAVDSSGYVYVADTGNCRIQKFAPGIPEDTTPPTVSSVSPQNGASDVAIDTVVTATFSEAMDSSTITTDSFTLAGSAVSGTVTYDSDTYSATFTPDANLEYNHEYTATLSTDITDEAGNPLSEVYTWRFTTEQLEHGYAIIVAGQADWRQKSAIDHSANNAYRVLHNLGFDDEHIFYLNTESQQIDGQNVVDNPASLDDLRNALDEIEHKIGDSPTPLILYLVGHGIKEVFDFYTESEALSSTDLREMLEPFQDNQMLIVIGSCYSGSFITLDQVTDSISGNNRIIITATHDDQKRWSLLGVGGWSHSSDRFWGNLNKGLNVKDAFITGAWPGEWWHLWLDDNGDNIGHPPDNLGNDGALAAATTIGVAGTDDLELTSWYSVWIHSAAELRVYDSHNRVTGLVNGEVKEEIPDSIYDGQNEIVAIFSPSDTYCYEVVGTDEGTYGSNIASIENGETTAFTATDIPTSPNATHQYTIDWEALSQGEKGVTVQIDSDGDGVFEQNFTTDDTFQLPIASFTYTPENPVVNETITFNASSSYDPDGNITNYKWNFGDGNIMDTAEPIITHFYASAGDYTVNLTVTDDDGATNTSMARVTVSGMPDLVIAEKWVCWPDNCTICYNVTNIGDGTAPACHNTELYVDGEAVAHDHVPVDLAPGESYIGCFDGYTWTYTPPSDNITVCADNNETVVEFDETNNCLTNIWMCGDVNCDGKVTMSDVRKVFNRYLDPNYPLDLPWAADVNCDGKVSMSDVRKVFNRYLDPGYELNCCCEGVG